MTVRSTTVTSFNETKHLDVVKETRDAHLLNMVDANVAPEDHDADTSKMAHDQDAGDIEKMPLQSMPAERIGT